MEEKTINGTQEVSLSGLKDVYGGTSSEALNWFALVRCNKEILEKNDIDKRNLPELLKTVGIDADFSVDGPIVYTEAKTGRPLLHREALSLAQSYLDSL